MGTLCRGENDPGLPLMTRGGILTHYPLVISAEGVVTKNFLKYLDNIGLTKNIFRVQQKAVLLQMSHIVCKFLGHNP